MLGWVALIIGIIATINVFMADTELGLISAHLQMITAVLFLIVHKIDRQGEK